MSEDRQEKPQGKEKKNEEPSIRPSIPPVSALERRTNPTPPAGREKEDAEGKTGEVTGLQVEPSEKEKETQSIEKMQWKGGEEAREGKKGEEVVGITHVVGSDEEPKKETKELVGGSLFPPSVSSPPSRLLRQIDGIVDKHLGDFSSEVQLVLQEENIHYSFPQSPHSTSNTDATAFQHALPHTTISQFSQYVSFYNPCPPVQDYVSSLHEGINSMLTELGDSWPSLKPATSQTNTDAALASTVSAFVSSIRAANAKTGRDDNDVCVELTATDVCASVSPALSRGGEVWQPQTVARQFPDAANCGNPSSSHDTLSVATSASGFVCKPANTNVLHAPPDMCPQPHWKPQQSHTSETNRAADCNIRQTQDSSITRTVSCTAGVEGGSILAGTGCEVTLPGFSRVSKPLTEPSHPSEPVSSPASVSVPIPGSAPAPPTTALSSLISQLQPEVFSSLVEIIKDVKRNSVQFYLHSTEPEDRVYEETKVT